MKAIPFFASRFDVVQRVTPGAGDNVFDGLLYEADSVSTSATVLPKNGSSLLTIWAHDGDVIPLRVAKVTSVQGGTNGRVFGLSRPREGMTLFRSAAIITPSDTLPNVFDALYVNGIGGGVAVSVVTLQGQTISFDASNLNFIPIRVQKVLTGTLATLIGFTL